VVPDERPERDRDFVPLYAHSPLEFCPLLHVIFQWKASYIVLIGMLQVKLKGLLVEPLAGEGVPKISGGMSMVVKVYHAYVH
jgi:hypothetical protein